MEGYAEEEDADVILWNGAIAFDHKFIQLCRKRAKRTNVLFVLITPGVALTPPTGSRVVSKGIGSA